jgi:hypothetical protein
MPTLIHITVAVIRIRTMAITDRTIIGRHSIGIAAIAFIIGITATGVKLKPANFSGQAGANPAGFIS